MPGKYDGGWTVAPIERRTDMNNPTTHTFTLILADSPEINDDLENALFEAGCDDALLGSRNGVTYLDFDREADTLRDAIESAIRDVQIAGYAVARIEPDDLTNAAEIARRIGRSRESIRQLVTGVRGPGGFPPPVSSITGSSPLWRWSEVAKWFAHHQLTDSAPLPEAQTIRRINAFLEVRNTVAHLSEFTSLWHSLAEGRQAARKRGKPVAKMKRVAVQKQKRAEKPTQAKKKTERLCGTTRHK